MPAERSWTNVSFTGFHQDVFGGEVDGVAYPPTLRWVGHFRALRSDGVWFTVTCPSDKDFNPVAVGCDVENSLRTLDEFRTCDCQVNAPCDGHR